MAEKIRIDTDLSDPAAFDQGIPQAAFAQMRAAEGLVWNDLPDEGAGAGFWSVGRFDDVLTRFRIGDADRPSFDTLFGS